MSDRYQEWPHVIIQRGPDYGKRLRIVPLKKKVFRSPNQCNVIVEETGQMIQIHRGCIKMDLKGKVQPKDYWPMDQIVEYILEASKKGEGVYRKDLDNALQSKVMYREDIPKAIKLAKQKGMYSVPRPNSGGNSLYKSDP